MCSVCFCMAFAAHGQKTTATIHEAPTAVVQNARLQKLSENVSVKEAALLQSVSSSRAVAATAADELNVAIDEYKKLLSLEIERAANDEIRNQLTEELQYAESKTAVKTTR